MFPIRNVVVGVVLILSAVVVRAEEDKASDRCALCHEQATKDWAASPHARAMDDKFVNEWTKGGKKFECLVCHTTQFDRKAGTFSH